MKRRHSLGVVTALAGALSGALAGLISQADMRPASAQEASCQEAIQAVRSDIDERLGGHVDNIQMSQIQHPPRSPYKQEAEVLFLLGSRENQRRSQRSADIMSSGSLLTEYSDRIIKNCADVVRVTFGVIATDWGRSFSWIDNRFTRPDECIEPNRGVDVELKWGQRFCL